jgi:hypothetical protein
MADIPQQLAALLGRDNVAQIRKTDETPPRISVIDVATLITGKRARNAARDVGFVQERYPEVAQKLSHFVFPGQGQRNTPVTCAKGVIEIVMLLPGRMAAQVRRQASELLVRYLGGDLSLISEVCRLRGLQEELAVQRPEDPRRVFGEAVEAASGLNNTVGEQLARMCATLTQRLTAQEEMLARIHERLDQDRLRVNLNVRAPKRASPHDPPIARDIAGAGRPFPLARFMDEKEREDPSWCGVRRSFAPTFGMQVQVLKKRRLREDGQQPIYIEQNHRPQLLYTLADRPLMEEAWEITAAHREELSGRLGNAPAAVDRPSVMDMLRGA